MKQRTTACTFSTSLGASVGTHFTYRPTFDNGDSAVVEPTSRYKHVTSEHCTHRRGDCLFELGNDLGGREVGCKLCTFSTQLTF